LLVVAEMFASGCGFDHADELIFGFRLEEGMSREELISKNPDELHSLKVGERGIR